MLGVRSLTDNKVTKTGAAVFERSSRFEVIGYRCVPRRCHGPQARFLTMSARPLKRRAAWGMCQHRKPLDKVSPNQVAIVSKDLPTELRERPVRAKPVRYAPTGRRKGRTGRLP